MPANNLYERDFFEWVTMQAGLLRAGRLADLDIDNLSEEVEAIGRSQLYSVSRRLTRILRHMLVWRYLPELRRPGGPASLLSEREDLAAVLDDSPSLRGMVPEALPRAYNAARTAIREETGLFRLPDLCEWSADQVLDPSFLP